MNEIERISEWSLGASDDREIAALLARCFDTDFGGRSFFQTRQHLRLVHRTDRIVAHMALQVRAMRLGGRLVTVVGLGDVATDPQHRGKGIAGWMLHAAVAEARSSLAEFMLLFGTAGIYAGAGFRTVQNPLIWLEMRGAVTQDLHREPARSLMVLPLREQDWDETAELDMLGNMF